MPDVLTVRESVHRAKGDGLRVTEYAVRLWIREGAIPTRKVGQKSLIYYPNLVKFLKCEDGCDNAPSAVVTTGIRRVDL